MRITLNLAAIAAICMPSATLAANFGVGVNLSVPAVCNVAALSAAEVDGKSIRIPRIREICNRAGYEVHLRYDPAQFAGSEVYFAGQRVILDNSGDARLLRANYAVFRTSELRLETPVELSGTLNLSLQMQPI